MIGITTTQQFDWTSPKSNCHVSFQVTRMLTDIASGKLPYDEITSPIDKDFALNWVNKRELNLRYIRNLTHWQLIKPVLGVWLPSGSVLLIDGSHRYMGLYLRGYKTIDNYIVGYVDWQPYATITGDISCE